MAGLINDHGACRGEGGDYLLSPENLGKTLFVNDVQHVLQYEPRKLQQVLEIHSNHHFRRRQPQYPFPQGGVVSGSSADRFVVLTGGSIRYRVITLGWGTTKSVDIVEGRKSRNNRYDAQSLKAVEIRCICRPSVRNLDLNIS